MKTWIKNKIAWLNNQKYRRKLNLVMILVGLIPLCIVAVFMIQGFNRILSEREQEAIEVSLKQVGEAIDQQVDIYDNLLTYTVFDSELQGILDKKQQKTYEVYYDYTYVVDPVLNMPKFYHEKIDHLTIYSDNIETAHGTTLAPLSDIENMPWFKTLKASVEEVWVWPDGGHQQLLAIRRIPGFHESEAYLGIYCTLEGFTDPMQYFEKEGAGIMMVDEDNRILFMNSSYGTGMTYDELEEQYMIVRRDIDHLPVSICVFMEKATIYQEFYTMLKQIVLVIAVCLLLIILVSRYMSRIMVRRIEALTRSINEMDPEDRRIDVVDTSQDEVGILVRSFKNMLAEINKLIREVYEGKIRQQRLEMKALRAQINPHFLYNTLSVINWKALAAGQEDISHVTLALSDFYRTTLNKGKNMITVQNELLNIRSYLDIQLVMHDNDFTVEYDIEDSLLMYEMPNLVLQPLVENSLEHGLDLKTEGEKLLKISCKNDKDKIVWTVSDTGVGMDQETCRSLLSIHAQGYGVRNVNERLELLYGKAASMYFESVPGEGTTVTVRIPKQLSEAGRGIADETDQ